MFRIGILGSDNSHALAFAKLCNLPKEDGSYWFPDVRITAIYGHDDDPEHTKTVAEQGKIEFIAQKPEDFFGKVDAVMAVHRNGNYHVPQALPFIRAGYPVWLDKPVAISHADMQALREAVEKHNALITGGSTMKYNYEVLTLQNKVQSGQLGFVQGGAMNFPGNLNDPYEGLFFYGPHLCEMCLAVFGYDVKSVYAAALDPENICVIAKYEDKQISLHFDGKCYFYGMAAFGDKGCAAVEVDASFIYRLGFEKWVEMLRTGNMPLSLDKLLQPTYMIHAILKSLEEGRDVTLEEVK